MYFQPSAKLILLTCTLAIVFSVGCVFDYRSKRCSEHVCPTDIRQSHKWIGEDAIMHCPCGPDEMFFGHKPTYWGEWPTTVNDWRGREVATPTIASPIPHTIIIEEPQPPVQTVPSEGVDGDKLTKPKQKKGMVQDLEPEDITPLEKNEQMMTTPLRYSD